MLHALALLALVAPQDPIDAHSEHGAAFDVGPRQAATLMDNPDRIHFPVSLAPGKEHLQAFVHQGMGQLHGFWFLEAERTFRQILSEDPDCAMASWGLAMANVDQPDRAAWFARAAWLKRGLVTDREQRYIDMIARFYRVEGPEEPEDLQEPRNPAPGEEGELAERELPKRKEPGKREAERLVKDYEELIWDHPDDVEAKALLANRIWLNRRKGIQTTSRMSVEALLQQVLAVEPFHPAHHYRIHLWDSKDSAERVVDTAVRCGPSWPGIAHNWHMGGHIFAQLGRHYDAAWQQEASARVDHAHMQRAWLLPDEIHNFAHNNEWLTRSLRHQGRVTESVELAKNMIELPRHPDLNSLEKRRCSAIYGRQRLLETLTAFEQWTTLQELGETMYLEPHRLDPEGALRAYSMGRAAAHLGDVEAVGRSIEQLEEMLVAVKAERSEAVDEAEEEALAADKKREEVREAMAKAMESFEREASTIRKQIASLEALAEYARGEDPIDALKALKDAGYDRVHLARMLAESGDEELAEEGLKMARGLAKEGDGKLLEQATKAYVLWTAGEEEEALEVFEDLREGAALAELELPPFQRLAPLALALELPADWRPEFREADDVALRQDVDLEALGPRHWSPPIATDWTLPDAYGNEVSLSDFAGRPVLVVNFLGFGCVHCVEQLQVLAPVAERFAEAGIEIVAIGLEGPEAVAKSLGSDPADTGFPFRVLCDPSRAQFKAWRAYDDFEDIALHGTYLVDGRGRIRWIDISHLPFMDVDFLLDESVRLLGLPVRGAEGAGTADPVVAIDLEPAGAPAAEVTAAEVAAAAVEPVGGVMVAVQLDTAPHCQNCVADLRSICSTLDGFQSLAATPNESLIKVIFEPGHLDRPALLAALEAGGRPGTLP